MAFSGSSYFAGVGTVVAAIGLGFACGAMITTSAVQPQNRLERVNAGSLAPSKADAPPSNTTSPGSEQASTATPPAQDGPPSTVAAAPPPAATSQPAPQPQPAAAATSRTATPTTEAASNVQEHSATPATARTSSPAPVTKSDDQATAKIDHATVGRAVDPNRDASHLSDANKEFSRKRADNPKLSDDRKFSERKRWQDRNERRLNDATNVVRQMPRDNGVDEAVDQPPRYGTGRPHRYDAYEDDDSPRLVSEPPPRFFGFFGN